MPRFRLESVLAAQVQSSNAVLAVIPVFDCGLTIEAIIDQIGCDGHVDQISGESIPVLGEYALGGLTNVSLVAIPATERWLDEETASSELKGMGLKLADPRLFLCFCEQYLRHQSVQLAFRIAIARWYHGAPGIDVGLLEVGTFAQPSGPSKKPHALYYTKDSRRSHLSFDPRGILDRWYLLAVPIDSE